MNVLEDSAVWMSTKATYHSAFEQMQICICYSRAGKGTDSSYDKFVCLFGWLVHIPC